MALINHIFAVNTSVKCFGQKCAGGDTGKFQCLGVADPRNSLCVCDTYIGLLQFSCPFDSHKRSPIAANISLYNSGGYTEITYLSVSTGNA